MTINTYNINMGALEARPRILNGDSMDGEGEFGQVDGTRKVSTSKYDFVKIRVWLGTQPQHYYVLSRYLISRTLTVTKLPQDKAIKIALQVKKWLVDNEKLDVTQDELEEVLFRTMRECGFAGDHVRLYRMMIRFQQSKRPLIIMVCGSACSGKSTLAQALASRLNLPSVLQTDALRELLLGDGDDGYSFPFQPIWLRDDISNDDELYNQFHEECRVMRRALQGELSKCLVDGKSLIIEGLHLDPSLYSDLLSGAQSLSSVGRSSSCRVEGIHQLYGDPVFIPLVLSMDLEDYPILAEDWLSVRVPSCTYDKNKQQKVLQRLVKLQEYIVGASEAEVVSVGILNFEDTLDRLHDHILRCVEQNFTL